MSFSLPISRRDENGSGWLGDLTGGLTASAQTMTNGRPQTRYSAHLSWSPWPIVQLRGSIDYAEAAPSFDQLDGPIVTTGDPLFDSERPDIAEPGCSNGD